MKTAAIQAGTLFVVGTPIGNLGDLTPRAVSVLRTVNLILAEDTRRFAILAREYNITTPYRSYHDHNEQRQVASLIEQLQAGSSLALVSEAGTPTINDPGYRLISACRKEQLTVSSVPGPCAAIAALSISGFETDSFCFQGFPSRKRSKRGRELREALSRNCATIFYESPYRILATISEIAAIDPERDLFIGRELTKIHEECLSGKAELLSEALRQHKTLKGEFVLIIRRQEKGAEPFDSEADEGEDP